MSEPPSDDRPAANTRSVELVMALLVFLFGALTIFDSVRLGFRWGSDGPEAGYFPFYVGLLICISSAVIFGRALRNPSLGQKVFVYRGQLSLMLKFMLPSIAYALLIGGIELGPIEIGGLGIYVASVIFIAYFMIRIGDYRWTVAAPVALGVAVFFFLVFEVWFKVPLPKGPLEAMLGLN